MSKIQQMERLLMRSRRLPWLVMAIVLAGLALAIHSTSRQVGRSIRGQMIEREAELLHAVLAARLETLTEGELGEDPADPVTQWAVLLGISRLEGVMGIRLFDAEGGFVDSFPPTMREAEVPAAVLRELETGQAVGRFAEAARLVDQYYPDPTAAGEAALAVPLLRAYVPLQVGRESLVGVAEFLIEGSGLAEQLGRLDRHLLAQAALVFLVSGTLLGLALIWAFRRLHGAHRDLAQRTESLLQANAALALAARTTALGAITSHLVHGLKSPLAGLQNLVASAAHREASPAPEDWAQAASSMRRMQALIQDVILVLREHPEKEQYRVGLGEVAQLAVGRAAGLAAAAGVEVRIDGAAAGDLDNRTANLAALILGNLVENAVQATPRGKSVRLETVATAGQVVYRVVDEGTGVAPDLVARLFSPMTSTKEGGSGLGLAIARQLAQHLEADLCLARNTGSGAWFELRLPASLVSPSASRNGFSGSGVRGWCFMLGACCLGWGVSDLGAAEGRWRWSHPRPHGNNIIDMAYSPARNLYVQAAEQGTIYTSRDAVAWLPRESGTRRALRAVAFLGDRIVVTGEEGTVLYADAEDDFRPGSLAGGPTTDWLEGVTTSATLAVAVGDNGCVYTSPDGVTWTRGAQSLPVWLRGVAWGGGRFVAVGEQGGVFASVNGTNWTAQSSPVTADWNRVAAVPGGFLAVGDGGVAGFSADGLGWASVNTGATRDLLAAGAREGDFAVAGDNEARMRIDGLWRDEMADAFGVPPWTYLSLVGRSNSVLLGGRTGMMSEGYRVGPAYAWFPRTSARRPWLFDLAWVTNLVVAVGDQSTVMTSVDGVDWDYEFPPGSYTNSVFLGVGGTTNLLLAAGAAGDLMISPHAWTNVVITNASGIVVTQQVSTLGIVWHAVSPAPTTNDLQGVAAWNGRYYVTGDRGTVLSTVEGTQWTLHPTPTGKFLSGIAGSSARLVACGDDGTLLRSDDGANWTPVASRTTNWLYRVRWANDRFMVAGQNGTLLSSPDGLAWTTATTGTGVWLTDVAGAGGRFYASGMSGTVLESADGLAWTNSGTLTLKALYAAVATPQRLVVAGVEGVILRRSLVADLTPVEILAFEQSVSTNGLNLENLYLFGGQPDQQFTLDYRPELSRATDSWTTGPTLELLDGSGTLVYLETIATSNAPPEEYYRATLVP